MPDRRLRAVPVLAQAASALTGSSVSWGAQDVSAQEKGAYTGEVSGAMLKEFGCRWALAGHSERRVLHGETDQIVADKARAALAAGLTAVVCVGESLADRDAGNTLAVIERQLKPVLALGAEAVSRMVLAYEPVWAIGTGRSASPEQAQEVHGAIRAALRWARPRCKCCTAAASRRPMPPACSPWPTSTAPGRRRVARGR